MDDELFGDLTGDDQAVCCNQSNPKQPGGAKLAEGLSGHEKRAGEENFRNIGYLEAFDAAKELKLQEGFETGYRETLIPSTRIGKVLGSLVVSSLLTKDMSSPTKEPVQPGKAARLVRTFMNKSQDHCACEEGEMSALLRTLEEELQGMS